MKKKILIPLVMMFGLIMLASNMADAECTAAAACNGGNLYCTGAFECDASPNSYVSCDGVEQLCESPIP